MKETRLQFAMRQVREGVWRLVRGPEGIAAIYPEYIRWQMEAERAAVQNKAARERKLPGVTPFGAADWLAVRPLAELTAKQREALLDKHLTRWTRGGHPGLSLADVGPVAVDDFAGEQEAAA